MLTANSSYHLFFLRSVTATRIPLVGVAERSLFRFFVFRCYSRASQGFAPRFARETGPIPLRA